MNSSTLRNGALALENFVRGDHDAALWQKAVALRQQTWGNAVFLRGIVEFSNHCEQNCLYCGLRRDNLRVRRYRMDAAQIMQAAKQVRDLGIGTLVLQSGEDRHYSGNAVARLVERVSTELGLAVTLSLGERSRQDFAAWRTAGAARYLLKAETFDEQVYARLRPGKTLAQRLRAYEQLAGLGYECGSGLIGGLPGETVEQNCRNLEQLAALQADMLSISPFIPHPDTPLKCQPAQTTENSLRLMALARVLVPRAHMPVTSALGLQGDAVRLKALEIADVLMPSLTPQTVRGDYAIYPGKNASDQMPPERARAMQSMLRSHGFCLPAGPGGAWRLEHKETL